MRRRGAKETGVSLIQSIDINGAVVSVTFFPRESGNNFKREIL